MARHATAALLNACNTGVNYTYTTAQIITLVRNAFNSGNATAAADLLETANEKGCPLGGTPATTSASKKSPTGSDLLVAGSDTKLSAYPNPYTDKATIEFSLKEGGDYTLVLHDVKGSVVKRISAGKAEAGKVYSFEIGNNNMPEGIYIARLSTDKFNKVYPNKPEKVNPGSNPSG